VASNRLPFVTLYEKVLKKFNTKNSCCMSSYFTLGITSTDQGAVVTLSIYGVLFIAVLSTATVKGFTG